MKDLENLALQTEGESHLDIFSIIYFAKIARKLIYFAYFYDHKVDSFSRYYESMKHALKKFVKIDDENIIIDSLKEIRRLTDLDILAIQNGDPVMPSKQEVILAYPGLEATIYHRIAHIIYNMGYKLPARVISEYAHRKTQIDIHPGAKIGESFSIDHGTGVVIGETAVVGNFVRIYQGVTLGAKWLNDASLMQGVKRHPTILDHVIIYANATILGGDTIIKENSVIGANAFITKSN